MEELFIVRCDAFQLEYRVYGGLPEPAAEQERAVHLVNVVLLAAIALVAMWRLAMRRADEAA